MAINLAELHGNIDREVAALAAFIDTLRAEQAALVRGESERIAEFAAPKSNHLFELTRLGDERGHLLSAAGHSTDRAGMERCLRECGGSAAGARNAWQKLLALTADAQRTNTTNGIIISTRLQHTQRALSSIFTSARIPGAYGADGNTVSLRTTQQLAVA